MKQQSFFVTKFSLINSQNTWLRALLKLGKLNCCLAHALILIMPSPLCFTLHSIYKCTNALIPRFYINYTYYIIGLTIIYILGSRYQNSQFQLNTNISSYDNIIIQVNINMLMHRYNGFSVVVSLHCVIQLSFIHTNIT